MFCMPREKAHEHRLGLSRGPAMSMRRGSAASRGTYLASRFAVSCEEFKDC